MAESRGWRSRSTDDLAQPMFESGVAVVKFLHGNEESEGSQMAQSHPLQELYDREINFKIETLWDGGFDVALVDAMHGYVARGNAKTFEEAVDWLVDHADNPLGNTSAASPPTHSTHRQR